VQAQFKVEAGAVGMEVDTAAMLLVGILSKRGIEATAKQLVKLIMLGQRWGHFVDNQLQFSVLEWKELGETMWEKTIMGEEKEEKEIKAVRELWRTVLDTSKAMKAEREVACAAAQMLAPESGKGKAPKPGALARVFGITAVQGMTGTTCKSIAEVQASAECNSDAIKGVDVLPEVAVRETRQRTELHPEILQPPGRGEEWLVSPTERAGEEAQPDPSVPPLYPPLPPSSEASSLSTPSGGERNELQEKKACDLLQAVLQCVHEMNLQLQHMSTTTSSSQQTDETPFPKCLIGPPASVRPGRWSDIIRDAILDRQWGAAANIGDTQALACPVVQVNGHGKWQPHDWKILQQARSTITQYWVKSEAA